MDEKSIRQLRAALTGSKRNFLKAYKKVKTLSPILCFLPYIDLGPNPDSKKVKISTHIDEKRFPYGTPREEILDWCQKLVESTVNFQERAVLKELSMVSGCYLEDAFSKNFRGLFDKYSVFVLSSNCRDDLLNNKWRKKNRNISGMAIYRTFIETVELGVVDRPETQELQIMAFWHGGVLVSPKNRMNRS